MDMIIKDRVIINSCEFITEKFKGNFPVLLKCKEIGNSAFKNSKFTGDLDLPNVKLILDFAFKNSQFNGRLNLSKCKWISTEAFFNSKFIGNADFPECQIIEDFAFYNGRFSGNLNIPKCKEIHPNAFGSSNFSQINIGKNITELWENCIGKHTEEFIDAYNKNNRKGGIYKWNSNEKMWEFI